MEDYKQSRQIQISCSSILEMLQNHVVCHLQGHASGYKDMHLGLPRIFCYITESKLLYRLQNR